MKIQKINCGGGGGGVRLGGGGVDVIEDRIGGGGVFGFRGGGVRLDVNEELKFL